MSAILACGAYGWVNSRRRVSCRGEYYAVVLARTAGWIASNRSRARGLLPKSSDAPSLCRRSKPVRWWEFQRVERQWRLLNRMLAQLGIETIQLVRLNGLHQAADQCMRCFESDRCEQWLSSAPVHAMPPAFCRNRSMFRRLIRQGRLPGPKVGGKTSGAT